MSTNGDADREPDHDPDHEPIQEPIPEPIRESDDGLGQPPTTPWTRLMDAINNDPEIRLLMAMPECPNEDFNPRITEIVRAVALDQNTTPEMLSDLIQQAGSSALDWVQPIPLFRRRTDWIARIRMIVTGRPSLAAFVDPAKIRELAASIDTLHYGSLIQDVHAVATNAETDYQHDKIGLTGYLHIVLNQWRRIWRFIMDNPAIIVIWCERTGSWWRTGPADRTAHLDEARRWSLGQALAAGWSSGSLGSTMIEIVPDGRRWRVSAFIAALLFDKPPSR
jgi:hypothetical protein